MSLIPGAPDEPASKAFGQHTERHPIRSRSTPPTSPAPTAWRGRSVMLADLAMRVASAFHRWSKTVLEQCHRWIDLATMVTAVFGVWLYFHEAPSRREAHDTAAWQILALQGDQTGNGGRRWAMQALVKDQVDLHGVRLAKADFSVWNADGTPQDGAWLEKRGWSDPSCCTPTWAARICAAPTFTMRP